jgi:chemotaxis protein MotA
MDWSSLSGISIALIGLISGQYIEGGEIGSLLQPAAFMIVMCGTCGAVLVQTSISNFTAGIRMLKNMVYTPIDDRTELAERIHKWSLLSRKEGLLMMENYLNQETDPYIKKGLQLLIDGTSAEDLRDICATEMHFYEIKQRNAAKIWDAAGGYAPTIGILGAVMGLIHVMENLSEPAKLGSGIAVAFVSTIYGVGLANLLFMPIANKLKGQIQVEMQRREMLLNAWISIAKSNHPRMTRARTSVYLT